jgi:N-acetylmuramoyl-L-alanine amidase
MSCSALAAAATSIVIAGQPYDVGRPVVLWCDSDRGFDAYSETCIESGSDSPCCDHQFKRYGTRRGVQAGDLPALSQVVSQLVLHHDGCVNSRSCFHSMHDRPRPDGGCGLSAHFMIDADGTIYQTLDVSERALHAGPANEVSIGVEICNRADASRNELDRLPAEYRTRPVRAVTINGRSYQAFDFRPEQYTSVIALARTLIKVFPQIRPVIPEQDGQPYLAALTDPTAFKGIVGHLHVDPRRRKWDPGAFDWKRLLDALNGLYFPVTIRGHHLIPAEELTRLATATKAAMFNVEERTLGSYPVGPGGLWDPGVYLRAEPGAPMFSPARGTVLAARMRGASQASSNFVLIRHDVDTPEGDVRFFSLVSGLSSPLDPAQPGAAEWIRALGRAGDRRALTTLGFGQVALLDVPIEGGDLVGLAGGAGRPALPVPQVRMELFTVEPLAGAFRRVFRYLDATGDGPVCRRSGVLQAMGVEHGSLLGGRAIEAFVRTAPQDRRQTLRRFAVRLGHPWGDRSTEPAFVASEDLAGLTQDERARIYRSTRAEFRFWTDALSSHARLPQDQRVYFHHPFTFLSTVAGLRSGVPRPWPAASIADEVVAPGGHRGRAAMEWLSPATSVHASGPLFGPLVQPQFRPRRRDEIQLLVLPALDDLAGSAQ